jgi:hypothetical protein
MINPDNGMIVRLAHESVLFGDRRFVKMQAYRSPNAMS